MRISTSPAAQRSVAPIPVDADQARAAAGGLQEHSIGPLYPWAVVGRGLEGKWEVHNLQESTVVHYRGAVWQGTCSEALGVAHMAKHGIDFMLNYTAQPEARRQQAFERSSAVVAGALRRPYAGRATGYDLRAAEAARGLGELPPLDVQVD